MKQYVMSCESNGVEFDTDTLFIYLDGKKIGKVIKLKTGQFAYKPHGRNSPCGEPFDTINEVLKTL